MGDKIFGAALPSKLRDNILGKDDKPKTKKKGMSYDHSKGWVNSPSLTGNTPSLMKSKQNSENGMSNNPLFRKKIGLM